MDTHIDACYNYSVRWKRWRFKRGLICISGKKVDIMAEEKKSTYKGQTDARRKASAKYLHETVEDIRIRVPKGQKDIIKQHAESMNESMNQFVIRAINTVMQQDSER